MHGSNSPVNDSALAKASRRDKRRPAGVSRRRKRSFAFETLESRQVMSAQSPLSILQQNPASAPGWQTVSYSSNTLEGYMAILQQELANYAVTSGSLGTTQTTRSIPTDPLLANQWHLINSGQQVGNPDFQSIFGVAGEDINVAPIWNMGYTGAGIKVAVIDSGVQLNHPDLAANIHPTLRFDAILEDGDPSPEPDFLDPDLGVFRILGNSHGTAVAGIIGSLANNGIGGAGVAPGASLVPIRLIDETFPPADFAQAMVNAFQYATLNGVDITNNSWGPGASRTLVAPTAAEYNAIRDSIFFGRDLDGPGGNKALGVIHIFASGNGGQTLDFSGFDGYASNRYVIGVTGVDHDGFYNNIDGTVTGYPEIGPAVLVAAPTGSVFLDIINDTGLGSGLVTTDPTDDNQPNGYNVGPNPANGAEIDRDFFDDTSYTSRFNGTSGSAPIVSGVVALMLEANPNLSWRDVQEILIRSARQNAPFGEGANGADKTFSQSFANTWIVNQVPLFHDPDPWDPTIDPVLQTYAPTLDPNLTYQVSPGHGSGTFGLQHHYAASPAMLTNGAGYTVSMGFGTNSEWYGYGHGVLDAELAVSLAQQWGVKNQALPDELTFTTAINVFSTGFIPAAQNTGEQNGDFVVPGGIGGETGFIDYYAEYFDDDPFLPDELNGLLDNPRSLGPIELQVPDDGNTMVVESVDITLTIDNWAAAMDGLRVVLVSPNGTHSELIQFYPAGGFADDFTQIDASGLTGLNIVSPNNIPPFTFGAPGSVDATGGTFTLTTKRSWGERSDNEIYYDPFTGDPIVDSLIGFDATFNPGPAPVVGDLLQRGWQLHFENWGDTDLNIGGIEIAWHGRPIAANSQRIQGAIGIDDNRDDLFNFSRVIRDTANETLFDSFDPTTLRLGDMINMVDPNQESFAANVTVTARRVSDGSIAATFVTGADGNYYFDLVPDDYIISIDDPQDRLGKDDSLTADGLLDHYKSEWLITEEWFRAWDRANGQPTEVLTEADGTPRAFLDANGAETVTGMRNINFLLDIGDPVAAQATFSGTVYADVNGDGAFNGVDINLPNVVIFGDVNRNGIRDGGEAFTTTDVNGNYTLVVPVAQAGVVNIGVSRPTNWTSTNDLPGTGDSKTDGVESFFVRQGDSVGNIVFAMKPPANNIGGGGAQQLGILLGYVFDDNNANQVREVTEGPAVGMTVFIDANGNGVVDAGDTTTVTNSHGAFVFTNVQPGQRVIRLVVPSPLVQTAPLPVTAGRTVQLSGSSTISDIQFGIKNSAIYDYGDLPAIYGDLAAAAGPARHKRGANLANDYWLGATRDFELTAHPSANADGDDLFAPQADEDGITFGTLVPGQTATLVATASRNGGVLQGWIDWNNDGDFNDVGERIISDRALNSGVNTVTFTVPTGANVAQVFGRFRYGEHSLNGAKPIGTPFGEALLGEVEDYQLDVDLPISAPAGIPSDADGDDDVDGFDFLAWQRNVGMNSGATQANGDANQDGRVNGSDLLWWKGSYGEIVSAESVVAGPESGGGAQQVLAPIPSGLSNELTTSIALRGGSSVSSDPAANASTDATEPKPVRGNASFVALASRLDGALGAKLHQHVAEGRSRMADDGGVKAPAKASDAFTQRDRAFDDLFGTRRRQGLAAVIEAHADGDEMDCDELFAALADHFQRPLG